MSSQQINLSSRLFDNINFIRSKSIVANTNANAAAFSLKRIERVWVVALALVYWNSFLLFSVAVIYFLFYCSNFLFTGTVSFVIWSNFFCYKKSEKPLAVFIILRSLYWKALIYPVFRGKKILCFAENLLWDPVFRGKI